MIQFDARDERGYQIRLSAQTSSQSMFTLANVIYYTPDVNEKALSKRRGLVLKMCTEFAQKYAELLGEDHTIEYRGTWTKSELAQIV